MIERLFVYRLPEDTLYVARSAAEAAAAFVDNTSEPEALEEFTHGQPLQPLPDAEMDLLVDGLCELPGWDGGQLLTVSECISLLVDAGVLFPYKLTQVMLLPK